MNAPLPAGKEPPLSPPHAWSPVAWSPVLLTLVALLGGCHGQVCADFADTYAEVDRKARPCFAQTPLPAFDAQHCAKNLKACDDMDLAQLEAQRTCYAKLDTCRPEQKDLFLDKLTECDGHAVSNVCEAAIF